jgi:hypothetical protein
MADDDLTETSGAPTLPSSTGQEPPDSVVLPESASAYYSPRPLPMATSHITVETEAVRLDPSIDPTLASTHRVSVDGLEPPPWLANRPASDSPTVLVPVIRARRRRRRAVWGIFAALLGAALGVAFGLARGPWDDDAPAPPTAVSPPAHSVAATLAPSALVAPPQVASAPSALPSASGPTAERPAATLNSTLGAKGEANAKAPSAALRTRRSVSSSHPGVAPPPEKANAPAQRAWFE